MLKYNVDLKTLLQEGLFGAIQKDCHSLQKKKKKKKKKKMDILWQIVCMIVIPTIVDNFASLFKGSIFLNSQYFSIQERFNKLKFGINTITKCGT